jgi:hypothetical protein
MELRRRAISLEFFSRSYLVALEELYGRRLANKLMIAMIAGFTLIIMVGLMIATHSLG